MQLAAVLRWVPLPGLSPGVLLRPFAGLIDDREYARARFVAWWNGDDPPARPERPPAAEASAEQAEPEPATDSPAKAKRDWAAALKPLVARFLALWARRDVFVGQAKDLLKRVHAAMAVLAARKPVEPAIEVENTAEPAAAAAEAQPAAKTEAPVEAKAPAEPKAPRAPVVDPWTSARIKTVQWLWGEGCEFPGGPEFILELLGPLNLDGDRSMLELGCGLGGTTRAIAKALGCSIKGFEPSPALIGVGNEVSQKAEMADAARVMRLDLVDPQLPPGRVDTIVTRLMVGAGEDHMILLREIDRHLKPGGQLLLIEQLLGPAATETLARDAWASREDRTTHPIGLEALTNALAELHYDVQIAEDLSPNLRALVVGAWEKVATGLEPGLFDADEIGALHRELELWHSRIGAYDSGVLKFVRLLAVKPKA